MGARSFPGNPWDGHTLSEQIEQATILLEAVNVTPKQVVVDLGYRGKDVDAAFPNIEIIHLGKIKTMTQTQRKWLMRAIARLGLRGLLLGLDLLAQLRELERNIYKQIMFQFEKRNLNTQVLLKF